MGDEKVINPLVKGALPQPVQARGVADNPSKFLYLSRLLRNLSAQQRAKLPLLARFFGFGKRSAEPAIMPNEVKKNGSAPAQALDDVLASLKKIGGFDELITATAAIYSLVGVDRKNQIAQVNITIDALKKLLQTIVADVDICTSDGRGSAAAFAEGLRNNTLKLPTIPVGVVNGDCNKSPFAGGAAVKSTMKIEKQRRSRKFNGINLDNINSKLMRKRGDKTRARIIKNVLHFTRKKY